MEKSEVELKKEIDELKNRNIDLKLENDKLEDTKKELTNYYQIEQQKVSDLTRVNETLNGELKNLRIRN